MLLTTEWTVRYTDRGQSRLQWRQLGHKKTIDRDCMVPRSAADRGHGGERCLLYTISATKWSGQTRSGPNHISRRRAGSGRYFFSLSASFNVPALLLLSRMPSCQYAEDLIGAPREKKIIKNKCVKGVEGSVRACVTMASPIQIPYTVAVLVK